MDGERSVSRKQLLRLAALLGAAGASQEISHLIINSTPQTAGREVNPLVEAVLPSLNVWPEGAWPLNLDTPEAEVLLLGSGATAGGIITRLLEQRLTRRSAVGAIVGAPALPKALKIGSQAVSRACGKEGDSIEQGARLIREAPLYTAARRISLSDGEAAEKVRQQEGFQITLGNCEPEETETGLLYTFPLNNSGFDKPPHLSLIIAPDNLKPRLQLPSEIDSNLFTASPWQILHLMGSNAKIIHAFGAMDYAGISFANELRAKSKSDLPIVPNLSVLYGSGGLIVTKKGSSDPNVWSHAERVIRGDLNTSTKEFKLRHADPNHRGVIFHSEGWETIGQGELLNYVNNQSMPANCNAIVLPQYASTSDTPSTLEVPFSEAWDRTFSVAFRFLDKDNHWRYGFASGPQNFLLSAVEMQSLATQSMEKVGAEKFEYFSLDLGGNTGFYQRTQAGYYNPPQEVIININNGQLGAPPLRCTSHTCVSAVVFETG